MPKSAFSVASTQSSDKIVKGSRLHNMAKNGNRSKAVDYNAIFEMSGPKKPLSGFTFYTQERMN